MKNNNNKTRNILPSTSQLNAALVGLVLCSATVLSQAAAPAYTLKIVTHGEGTPRSDNMNEPHRQDNRRADVRMTTRVKGSKAVKRNVTETVKVKVSDAVNRSITLADGGIIWLTNDPANLTPTLNVSTSSSAVLTDGKFESPLSFTVKSNYTAFIDHWNLSVYHQGSLDADPIASMDGQGLEDGQAITWEGDASLKAGETLDYVFTVYDDNGHRDVTQSKTINLLSDKQQQVGSEKYHDRLKGRSHFADGQIAKQTIPIHGSRVRIYGSDIPKGYQLKINDKAVNFDTKQKFVNEYLLPTGTHQFDVAVTDQAGKTYQQNLGTNVDGKYLFMVGLADFNIGESKVTGNIEPLEVDQSHYDGDIFVDGRLAFYLKGKVKGKYLITAQLDTGTEDVKDLFDNIHKKDPRSLFRRLDPDKYYPVYGDDSTLIDDTDSIGKMYVRVDWDKSRAIWGNFNTGLTGTEFAQFNRSLYGAQLHHKSTQTTASGEHKTEASVFGSEGQSAFRHNQFLGTGGSLYYLKDSDIVRGSEKVWVEIRQRETERAVEKILLVEGRDYEMDDFQGRIILTRPLMQIAGQVGPSIIKDTPLDGNQAFLMVDYEYVPDDFDANKATYGGRGKVWLNDQVAVGGTFVHENRDADDYEVKGVDVTYKKDKGTYIKAEYAESESSQTSGSFLSEDGGINFSPFANNTAASSISGQAYGVEARANLDRKGNKSVGAWWKRRESGFSTARLDSGVETTDAGAEAIVKVNDKLDLSARATQLEKTGANTLTTASVEADYKVSDLLSISAELRHVMDDLVVGTDGEGTLAAVKVGMDVKPGVNIYGIAQTTVSTKGSYTDNDLFTIGTIARLNNKLSMKGEFSTGDRGEGATFGLDYAMTDTYGVYGSYTLSTDRSNNKRGTFTAGQRKTLSDQLRVYTEHQFTHEDEQSGLGHTFGLDYKLSDYTAANVSVQSARLDNTNGGITDRDAFSVGLTYHQDKTHANTRLEYRKDKGANGANVDTEQWLTSNRINYQVDPSMRIQGKFNYSITEDNISNLKDAQFAEAGIGLAYRPVDNDRFNMLGRLTYLYDLQPLEQTDKPDEKAVIASVEAAYDIDQKWEIGGKVAYKKAEIRQDRAVGIWHDNDATLAAVRARYHMTHNWDGLIEYHWLNSVASQDTQHGAMVSVDRHIGKNMKVGVGYNFTDFNDDLRNTDGDATGWFINFVGKY